MPDSHPEQLPADGGGRWPHTGELYFFPAGHTLVYDEPSKVIEINPAAALATLMDHVEDVIAGWSPEVPR